MSPYNRKNLKWEEQYLASPTAELLEMLPYYDNKTEPEFNLKNYEKN